MSAEVVLCTNKTTIFCQFGNLEICPNFANPYLTQFSSISGGNCITVHLKEMYKGIRHVLSTKGYGLKFELRKDIIKSVKSEENEADIFTKNTTNVIFSNHQKKLVWDKTNVDNEMIQEPDQSENQQEGC